MNHTIKKLIISHLVELFLLFSIISVNTNSILAHGMKSYANIVAHTINGVVNIRTTEFKSNSSKKLNMYQFFLNSEFPTNNKSHSIGSGIIINKNGYILTNYHVIKNAQKIDIIFPKNKTKLKAKIIGVDIKTDIALLKVKSKSPLPAISLGNSDGLRVGDIVLAIGNPFGYAQTVTSGIISAVGRVLGTGPYDNFLQTDASIHAGNSGGPLLDSRGRVIGINTAVSSEGSSIGFAIPINLAKMVVKQLKLHGKVRRPFLGIVGENILSRESTDITSKNMGVYGVIVTNLVVKGAAYRAGIKMGDVIVKIDKHKIYDINKLQKVLDLHKPGDSITIKVYSKASGAHKIHLRLTEIPSASELPVQADLF